MTLEHFARYLDEYLRLGEIPDYEQALNGIQVEGDGRELSRIAAAVDASGASIRAAVDRGFDLLLVHHGLFWDGNRPVTGRRYRRLAPLIRSGVALYSAHLPLDVHPEVGNSPLLARELEIDIKGRFGDFRGEPIGVWGELELRREALAARLDEAVGRRVLMVPGGPERVRRIGVATGAGSALIPAALEEGLDSLITGEAPHHSYFDASEGGLNLFLAGHYATETWGVRALAAHMAERFGLEWEFLDFPTGL